MSMYIHNYIENTVWGDMSRDIRIQHEAKPSAIFVTSAQTNVHTDSISSVTFHVNATIYIEIQNSGGYVFHVELTEQPCIKSSTHINVKCSLNW